MKKKKTFKIKITDIFRKQGWMMVTFMSNELINLKNQIIEHLSKKITNSKVSDNKHEKNGFCEKTPFQ